MVVDISGESSSSLPNNASVLDLSCGTGFPVADYFMKLGHNVTGIDGSEAMIQKCQKRYPGGDWRLEDMRKVDLDKKFDAIIAWDSFFHLPHNDQIAMFDVFKKMQMLVLRYFSLQAINMMK